MKVNYNKICGIYKITSPSNKVYIGQSIDIQKRFYYYNGLYCKCQTKLLRSFKKHGVKKHRFEILHQCSKEELNKLEQYYIQLFQCFNSVHGLNLKSGGNVNKMSDETKLKIKLSNIGKNKGRKPWNTGTVGIMVAWNKGLRKETDERVKQLGISTSRGRKGIMVWNKGKKGCYSPDQLKKMSETAIKLGHRPPSQKGVKQSIETIKKKIESRIRNKNLEKAFDRPVIES